ncbi:solute carrier family 28 member 3 [Mus musculus]|uniref:Solute carrier family 28 member 3 n=2 Tax=Mus musculus TaxID=10090 RepID=S28A3_MOUSE|nr:solute carrier family 28 member 3 [Mus musculus]Q9ERH8.1 RecName: Full=Solute carrier family 28 member 3; AltName: Full=Concentrative Na(+)-nucleoside cotransporter 3; Short=CNT 3; Short=mCNT3 [Mus musculus]AAG22552.1 concentrative Na+-nucleoside cotransporter mCNT3 [Mus musculus]EDL41268.1 solute carrier family 28 (sodium-coupled nucleoside transporter), member 3 [Mus musculus]|eukprot:NP_071712.3 solute carrier family 28 member 3 [Mus musculus]
MSRADPGKNSEPSESKMSLELRPTAPSDLGRSNEAFQDEDLERQNTPGNSTVRNRVVQSGEQGHAKQDDRQITIEQEPLGNKEDPEDDSEDEHQKGFLERKYDTICEFCRKHRVVLRSTIWAVLLTGFLALVIAACAINFHRALPLFVITLVTIFFVIWDHLMAKYEQRIDDFLSPGRRLLDRHWFWLKWVVWSSLILAIILWLSLDTAKLGQQNLVSFGGLIMYLILLFLFSKHPTRVYWRPVFWGIGLQFLLGLLILRTRPGFVAFDWMGRQVQTFLGYTDTGARFVFGEKYTDHFFAFKILPIVVFFSTVMSMLYYLGLMQWIIRKVGWLMLVTMGSSPIESVVAAGNIFIGQTESPLLVQPYLPHVTKSELHTIMTAGFATIAGSVLGAYISFGVSSTHLLTASVMSAPAALAVAKLFWPETEKPKITLKSAMKMENGDSRNLLEAASQGASSSIPLVANIAANLIAFLALLSFVNSALSWFGSMFNYPELSFELICSYIFMPFSFMMGVDWQDSFMVAKLIGYKTFFNEFVAYDHLSKLINLRKAAGPKFVNGVQQYMSIRSETIATYALCGFANFGSLGIVIGGLTSIAPSRKRDIASGAMRALIAGTIACFMTACIAGILSDTPVDINCHHVLENGRVLSNTTEVVSCCQNLFNSTVAKGPNDVVPGGNFSLYALKSCCNLLKPPTLNCNWIPNKL